MDYERFYRDIKELQEDLQAELLLDAEEELGVKEHLRRPPDYRKVLALAATYNLQGYVSELRAIGRAAEAAIQAEVKALTEQSGDLGGNAP